MAAPVLVDAKKETFQRLKEASRPNMYLVPDVSGSSAFGSSDVFCSVPPRCRPSYLSAPAAFCQALVSELKEELMRLVGSTKKTQKIDNAPGMEVSGHAAGLQSRAGGGVREKRSKAVRSPWLAFQW